MMNDLFDSIGKQLNIPKSADDMWFCRIVYSVAGKMALASLWDHNEDNSSISIQHFKNRIRQIFDAYTGIYPDIEDKFFTDKSNLVDEIYSDYLRTGFIYHSAYKVSPALDAHASCDNLTLYRCAFPNVDLFMSGIGFYYPNESSDSLTVERLFGLQTESFDDYLNRLLNQNKWEFVECPENAEFLRLDPPFYRGYWKQTPDKNQRISLVRYGEPNRLFAFYRYYQGEYQQKTIPEWVLRDCFSNETSYGEYRRIAVALFKKYNNLPSIKVKKNDNLVEIKVGYRLPPSEEDFFKLYSWPVRFKFTSDDPQVFTRIMAKPVYSMFKHTLETIGYCFWEE